MTDKCSLVSTSPQTYYSYVSILLARDPRAVPPPPYHVPSDWLHQTSSTGSTTTSSFPINGYMLRSPPAHF
jgi:hypothetical protein